MIDISRSFLAKEQYIKEILQWVNSQISTLNLSQKISYHLELCLEEVAVNIIHYSYEKKQGYICIDLKSYQDKLVITVKDQGVAFNPISKLGSADTTSSLEDRAVGGLGIYFLHELMDSIEYSRKGDTNILVFSKTY